MKKLFEKKSFVRVLNSARPSPEGPQAADFPARVRQARPSVCNRRRRPPPLPAAPGRARADRPGAPNGRASDQGSPVPGRKEPGQLRLRRHPLAQQDPSLGAGPLGIRHPPREHHRAGQHPLQLPGAAIRRSLLTGCRSRPQWRSRQLEGEGRRSSAALPCPSWGSGEPPAFRDPQAVALPVWRDLAVGQLLRLGVHKVVEDQ